MNTREKLVSITDIVQNHEDAPSWALVLKLGEEVGEFNEAMLKELGFLQHKELKEGPLGEAADIIITTISILAVQYKDMPPDELITKLEIEIHRKFEKYKKIMGVEDVIEDKAG